MADDSDLEALKTAIGDARIVGLGEASHGTHEFFTLKHRLVRFLAKELGFSIFAIEANMPEAYNLNKFVMTGRGDPKELLAHLGYWTWNTQEVLDMVLWMREFNASGRGTMQFTGFDMQNPFAAIDTVRTFVEQHDPTYLDPTDKAYDVVYRVYRMRNLKQPQKPAAYIATRETWRKGSEEVLTHLLRFQDDYADATPSEIAWAIQNARIIVQNMEVDQLGGSRDTFMADNVTWLAEQNPKAKIVLWAHNGHIQKSSATFGAMGSLLAKRFGNDYAALGFAFYQGSYNASTTQTGPRRYHVGPQPPRSVGGVFHDLGLPIFALDLQHVEAEEPSSWFTRPQEMLQIEAIPYNRKHHSRDRIVLAQSFDIMIFVDQMTASKLLK